MKPLTREQWILLDNLMSSQEAVDPNEEFSATGFHYQLQALLQQFGYRNIGRYDVWETALKLWSMTPEG
jgi:hypothetical protein